MKPFKYWKCRLPLTALAVLAAAAFEPAAAQETGRIGGRVISGATAAPVSGAQVFIPGTGIGTLTNDAGVYLLEGVSAGRVTVRVERLGYQAQERGVDVAAGERTTADFQLSERAIAMDEIVVTGTPGGTQKRSLGNVVSTIDAGEIIDRAPVNSITDLMNGRAPGMTILSSTGVVGGASRVTLRGASSFSLSNAPLIYVDGIRVNNDETSGPANQGFGNQSISRFGDFDPDEIESIEIIRGPAAATLYGTEAANGVIQIITKKGVAGATRFNLKVRQGANWFADPEGRLYTNFGMVDGELQSVSFSDLAAQEERLGNPPLFQTGHLQSYDLNVSGGSDLIQYHLSGGFERNQGVEPTNLSEKLNARVNLTATPSEDWRITGNVGYVDGTLDLPCEAGCGGNTWATYFSVPRGPDDPSRSFTSRPPEFYHQVTLDWQDLTRFTGSLQVQHNPASWFSHRLNVGKDVTQEQNNSLFNRDDRFIQFTSFAGVGARSSTDRQVDNTTFDYSGTVEYDLTDGLVSSTSFGTQYYREHAEFTFAYGEGFPVPGLTSVNATTQNRTGGQSFVTNTTVGLFVEEKFSSRDRRFLTLGLRADDNSAFGRNFDLVYYPKISAAWVVSEEPFFDFGGIDILRLRAAWGESGQQPSAFAALRTFQPVTGPNDVGTITPGNVGNPDLGPERASEIEVGLDAGLFDDRLGVEFTYYDRSTRDAILLREIAPSTGFSGDQFVNAGEIESSGMELQINGTPYRSADVGWDLSLNIGTHDNEVVSLGDITDEEFVSAGAFSQHRLGFPIGSLFGRKVVSAELDNTGTAINAMCEDRSGGLMSCDDAPDIFLGSSIPEMTGGVNTTLTLFGNLRLFAQVDFKTGFAKIDGNERVRCWFFDRCLANHRPEEADPVEVAGYQQFIASSIIESADFAKLREVSASYTLPSSWGTRFGADRVRVSVAGRNLMTWTDYSGLEPEATFHGGGSRGGQFELWEQSVLPQLAHFVATIDLSF